MIASTVHQVPDPPTQSGCTSCGNDLRHGLIEGDRIVVIAPMTKRMPGIILGFALDKADVRLDERPEYPLTVHSKWLAREEHEPGDAITYEGDVFPGDEDPAEEPA